MEVSSFELIYKPQSPAGEADVVLQGYFLNITNLEEVDLIFQARFVTSSVSDPDRSLANNTIAFIDTPTQNNVPASLVGALAAPSFGLTPAISIPSQGTAKIAVLPSDPFPVPVTPANFEARGYVTLNMPTLVEFGLGSVTLRQQLDRPANVLLTPQNRATYFSAEGEINDQTQSSLPTASGAARDEVPTSGFLVPPLTGIPDLVAEGGISVMPEFELRDMVMMFAALQASGADLKPLNQGLKDVGIGLAVEHRKI